MTQFDNEDSRTLGLRQIAMKLKRHGVGGTFRYIHTVGIGGITARIRYYLSLWRMNRVNRNFDAEHNVDTWAGQSSRQLGIESESAADREIYVPVPQQSFRFVMDRLHAAGVELSSYTFVDYGSGKGKAVFLAAEFPFSRIIGVEFSDALHDSAVENLQNFRSGNQRCSKIRFIHEDATTFSLPDSACLLFFYSPFYGPVMQQVLDRIERSFASNPRPLVVCFVDDDDGDTKGLNAFATALGQWDFVQRMPNFVLPADAGAIAPLMVACWTNQQNSNQDSRG
nr:class I SAM-dependent methyltransferase [Oceanococcus sp. HetDA_MAG_MS8]